MQQLSRRIFLATLCILVALVIGSLLTAPVQTAVARMVVSRLLDPTGMRAEVSGLWIRVDGRVTLREAVLHDSGERQAVRIEDLSLEISLRKLFSQDLVVHDIRAEGVSVSLSGSLIDDFAALGSGDSSGQSAWTVHVRELFLNRLEVQGVAGVDIPAFSVRASGFTLAGSAIELGNAAIENERDLLSVSGRADFPEFAGDLSFTVSRETLAGLGLAFTERVAPAGSISGDVQARVNGSVITVSSAAVRAHGGASIELSGTVDIDGPAVALEIAALELETSMLEAFLPALAGAALPERISAAGFIDASSHHGEVVFSIASEPLSGDFSAVVRLQENGEAVLDIILASEREIPPLVSTLRISGVFGKTIFEIDASEGALLSGTVELAGYVEGDFTMQPQRQAINARFRVQSIPDLLTRLFPFIPRINDLQALLVIESGEILLDMSATSVTGDGYAVDALRVHADGSMEAFTYRIGANEVTLANARVYNVGIAGQLHSREMSVGASLEDAAGDSLLTAGLLFRMDNNEIIASFTEGGLTVRGRIWSIPHTNEIRLSREAVSVRDMVLVQDGARITIAAEASGNRVILNVENFSLSQQIPVELDFDLYGVLDAYVEIDLQPALGGVFELHVRDLAFAESPAGNLALTGSMREGVAAEILLVLEGGQIESSVRFDPQADDLEILVELHAVPLNLLAGVFPQEIEEASGSVNGSIAVGGTLRSPDFSGSLAFDRAALRSSRFGVSYRLGAEELSLEGSRLYVSNLRLTDETGGSAELSGTVLLDFPPENISYDLRFRAQQFTVLDTTRSMNPQLYGVVRIGANLGVRGQLGEPEVTGELRIDEGTNVTTGLSRRGMERGRGAGIVRFGGEAGEEFMQDDTRPLVQGISLTASLSIAPDATLNLIIDPRTGDRLQVRGGGDFSIGIDPGGTMDLSGTYTVEEGRYELHFLGFAERSFDLRPGGTITWSGAFEDAALDLTAEYSVRTSPGPLLAADGEMTPAGNLVFLVVLHIKGTLLEPDISLTLDMPDDQRRALGGRPYTAIQNTNLQESERNTQAFALVVLNQFLPADGTAFDETAVFSTGTRSSLSDLLTFQLNRLSQSVLPGLDLVFDIDSFEEATDEGPEGRTEVQVELSQRLFNDRVTVRLGGQVDVERTRDADTVDVGTDASVEYALTEDGRFRIRAFFERSLGADVSGTVTGISFIFGRDFDPFDHGRAIERW